MKYRIMKRFKDSRADEPLFYCNGKDGPSSLHVYAKENGISSPTYDHIPRIKRGNMTNSYRALEIEDCYIYAKYIKAGYYE